MVGAPERSRVVRVLIVDDEPDLRLLLRTMLDLEVGIDIAGEAADGGEALERFAELEPDVLVLDQRMPVLNGLEVAERVLRDHPAQPIILFTAFVDPSTTDAARALGVQSVVGKDRIEELPGEILRLGAPPSTG